MTGPDQVDGVGDRMVKMRLESDANATSDRSGFDADDTSSATGVVGRRSDYRIVTKSL
ncbi:hypothetical protein U8335_23175 [Roseiconus lacunae]|uniref:Uncharacterized protein n=1 Tax=Roseiconus lacunae TaxID=2605694 RepID=A0ABT7PE88_9BACT|nr:hypothetical protein [Roseiconus lacunae]MCD0459833.1 hypothetical protein [Roseiconus lacunae]MDM4014531.1 hypothetical protein [Roseiconus lacunae]WRQ49844.1 hypothetical protein U8335_23175 [Stieleria sp. HD01]